MRLLISGGGTGGHIYPALAIAGGFVQRYPGSDVLYVGTGRGLEADIVPRAGLAFKTVTIQSLPRKLSPAMAGFGLSLLKGLVEARKIIREFRPDFVVGTGGYVCVPVTLTAVRQGVPTLLHEQNALPGIANKQLSRFVKCVALTFPEAAKHFPTKARLVVTGLPVRPEVLTASREKAWANLGLKPGRRLVVVTGGSRGARSLNCAMAGVYQRLAKRSDVQFLHLTGQQTYQETLDELASLGVNWQKEGNISIRPYLYNMEDAYAAADLIVCRAGAATLAELTVRGLPAILVPYPYAAENHQEYNARALEDQGAALVLKDQDLSGNKMAELVGELLDNNTRLAQMGQASLQYGRPNALEEILNCLDEIRQ